MGLGFQASEPRALADEDASEEAPADDVRRRRGSATPSTPPEQSDSSPSRSPSATEKQKSEDETPVGVGWEKVEEKKNPTPEVADSRGVQLTQASHAQSEENTQSGDVVLGASQYDDEVAPPGGATEAATESDIRRRRGIAPPPSPPAPPGPSGVASSNDEESGPVGVVWDKLHQGSGENEAKTGEGEEQEGEAESDKESDEDETEAKTAHGEETPLGHMTVPEHGDEHAAHSKEHAGEHSHSDEDPAKAAVSRALGFCLMGSVGWIMMLFYQVNSKDEDIRKATWHILSDMVSIFIAVLFFASTKHISEDFFGEPQHGRPDSIAMIVATVRLVLLYCLVQGLLFGASYRAQDRKWSMEVVGIVGGHVIGFAAIDVFGYILNQPFAESSALVAILVVLCCMCTFTAVLFGLSHALKTFARADHDLCHVATECQDDGSCLCYGLLVSMVVRFMISGSMPPVHGHPVNKNHLQVCALLTAAVVLGSLVVATANGTAKLQAQNRLSSMRKRGLQLVQLTLSLSMGWCVLYWGQWLFWTATSNKGVGTGSEMSARMLMALCFSVGCFLAIRIVDYFADNATAATQKGLRQLLSTFGIVMGLCWEACFMTAIDGMVGHYHGVKRTLMDLGCTLGLSAVVIPAWALFILPHALDEKSRFTDTPEGVDPVKDPRSKYADSDDSSDSTE